MELPDWVLALIGRLTVENEILRRALTTATQTPAAPAPNDPVPEPEPAQ